MQITFLGATETVTGSKYLITTHNKKILIDCGLFQGLKELRLRNWEKLPIDPRNIDYVILTHAHIDHSGYIPLLVKQGFKGKILCSEATFDLCKILLPDSGFLQEEDARRANKYGYSKHKPALPLYTEKEAEDALDFFVTIGFGVPCYLDDNINVVLSRSGHILGSAFISLFIENKSIVFSGDIGRKNNPVMKSPAILQDADYIVVESTYGNKLHAKTSPLKMLADVIKTTAAVGGSVLIPAFAVGRTQDLLYYLYELKHSKEIPDIPIYMDSPMAIDTTGLLLKYKNEHKLPPKLCDAVSHIATYVNSREESKQLDDLNMPAIIISASGMATGGRVLHHLKNFMVDAKNTILFAGFQAAGTRGDRMIRGEEEIKIHGKMYPLKARVCNLENMSAHADYEEILSWLANFRKAPQKIFVTHGEKTSAEALAVKIEQQFNWQVVVPKYLQREEL